MRNLLRKRDEGFTIIEVLIVLAIAGLIMLIVFLAVPALQRNARNTQRNNDASLVAAAVNECLANRNGRTDSCGPDNIPLDESRLGQLMDDVTLGTGNSLTGAQYQYGKKCTDDGAGVQDGSQRQFVVTFAVEDTSGAAVPRCIDS
jgi:prepilin-type N-terminal cleavage/methylation domain-containing protein